MSAVNVNGLTKSFGKFTAVDNLEFEVKEGEIFGLLGPNGAGKTTTIRMICGMLQPTKGTAVIAGFDVSKKPQEVKRRIGLVPDVSNMFTELSARVNLEFMGKLYGLDKKTRNERIDQLLELFQLADRQHDLIKYYSKGMHRRMTIAAALIHNPEILIMDEPTSGLDAQTSRLLRGIITDLNKEGRTILITTHQIDEADRLAKRVGIIDHGRLVALGNPEKIKNGIGEGRALELRMADVGDPQKWISIFGRVEGVENVSASEDKMRIFSKNITDLIPRIVGAVEKNNGKIEDICVMQPTLEDAFISLTGKSIREEPVSKEYSLRRKAERSGMR